MTWYYGREQSSFYKGKSGNARATEKSGDKRGNIRYNNKAIVGKGTRREKLKNDERKGRRGNA